MTKINEFENKAFGFGVRQTQDENGVDWFSAPDVYMALGLTANVLRAIPVEDKKQGLFPATKGKSSLVGGNRKATGITIGAVYSMVLKSRKPEAKAFQHWLTHEVIPSLRKNGGYIVGQENLSAADKEILDMRIRLLSAQVEQAHAETAVAVAKKNKLEAYLNSTEDNAEALLDRLMDCRHQLKAAEERYSEVLGILLDEEKAKKLISALRLENEEKKNRARAEIEQRIPYAKESVHDPDPIICDAQGNVMRRSEFIGADKSR